MPLTTQAAAFLLAALFSLDYLLPVPPSLRVLVSSDSVPQTLTHTYRSGDGRGSAGEASDATITSKFTEGRVSRPAEFEGDATAATLDLKHSISGTPSTVETRRFLITFPNFIGARPEQVPSGAEIASALLTFTLSARSTPQDENEELAVTVYRVTEPWIASAPGYLGSPNWRQRMPAAGESEHLWTNPGAEPPVSSHSVPVAAGVLLPQTGDSAVAVDVTAAVQAWLDGAPNYGLMVRLSDEVGSRFRSASFYSSEWASLAVRPALEIAYRVPPLPSAPPQTTLPSQPVSEEPMPSPPPPSLVPTPAPKPPAVRPSPSAPQARPPVEPPAPRLEITIPPPTAPEAVTPERPTGGLRRVIQNLWETILNWFR